MQELIVITSKSAGLLNGHFKRNGVGRQGTKIKFDASVEPELISIISQIHI